MTNIACCFIALSCILICWLLILYIDSLLLEYNTVQKFVARTVSVGRIADATVTGGTWHG